ncbi:hypothetical protein NG99_08240 [Erwinia typographi]|uniref:Knr4/Smi1-like domain-containing protein n=1 Tax=Erwinia typographi TaxID=371042 RepID=A0A0A4A9T3_9GAMM|nr:hypothetical protein [Erwinia typographi]KGT94593.1 hypothetical protein NG99_08240 [Erwinia typographi]
MSDIHNTLENFVDTCKKYSISGHFEVIDDLDKIYPDNLPRSAEMDYFYKNYNPEELKIETGFTPIKIYGVTYLEKAQTGYGYLTDNYIVIGDDLGGGKPIIAVTDDKNTPIFANYDVGEPFRIADDFCDFVTSLTELIELVYGSYNIFDIADDNDEIKKDFTDKLKSAISPIIGDNNFNAFYDYFYG